MTLKAFELLPFFSPNPCPTLVPGSSGDRFLTSLAKNSCGTSSPQPPHQHMVLGDRDLLSFPPPCACDLGVKVPCWALPGDPFSSSFAFVEKVGAGSGTVVTYKPVNKAASADPWLSVLSWVMRPRCQKGNWDLRLRHSEDILIALRCMVWSVFQTVFLLASL